MRTHRTLPVSTLCALLLASSAWAQIEINHAKAIAGGVTPGDTPGYPVTLSLAGSYKLTGILSVPNANTDAIVITADYITLDLNGFLIHGTTVCTGKPHVTSCSPTGSGVGIRALGHKGMVVTNGQIFGMGSVGIFGGSNGRIEHIVAQSNGFPGMSVDHSNLVINNQALNNGGSGISVGHNNTVLNNTVSGNGSSGIDTLSNNTVLNNTVSDSGGVGLSLDTGVGYAHNVLNNNNSAAIPPIQVIGGVEMPPGSNVCNGDTTCP